MVLRSAQVFKKSVVSSVEAGASPAAPTAPTTIEAPFLPGQAHLHEMAGHAAFQHAQSPQLVEPAHRLAHRSDGETQSAGWGHDRKLQAELASHEGRAQGCRVAG